MGSLAYSSRQEASRIFDLLGSFVDPIALPREVIARKADVQFTSKRDLPYFPIPLKETETTAALKAIEGSLAVLLAETKDEAPRARNIHVNLEKTTAFLFQAYLARVGGLGKLDKNVRSLLKDTDLLQAQSNPYRRMSANLYESAELGEYYHIHGSLEASTTLKMIGLPSHWPELQSHEEIVGAIEPAVKRFTIDELEALNKQHRQAGVKAFKHEEFAQTSHGRTALQQPPWTVENIENNTPPIPLPRSEQNRPLSGIKVLEICRIIAGPTITRILGEYGADVLKITSPNLSDVPFFQVDGNMGKHATDIDLKTLEGKEAFEKLLLEADVLVDGYRPGALEKLGYGVDGLKDRATKRGKGIVYVNENCFGYTGEWCDRPGWQQIADCVSGVAWAQGKFMGLNEPVVPPFPISDYGTGCMGAIAALAGLYHRTTRGGSWHGKVSLLQYDLLLFKLGLLPEDVQAQLRDLAGEEFFTLRHAHSVDHISGVVLRRLRQKFPDFIDNPDYLDHWYSAGYENDVSAVKPVVEIDGLDVSFKRASRPNGTDRPSWDFTMNKDYRKSYIG